MYRFWRDAGYVFGAILAGTAADALSYGGAVAIVAALTALSGLWVLHDMPERRGEPIRPEAASAARPT